MTIFWNFHKKQFLAGDIDDDGKYDKVALFFLEKRGLTKGERKE